MATAKQIAWRKKFAAMYGRKKKGKAKSSPSRSSKNRGMKMARRRRSYPKRVATRTRRSYRSFRRNRQNVIPVIDVLHGMFVADGLSGGNVGKAAQNAVGALSLTGGDVKFDAAIKNLEDGANFALKDPKTAILRGAKNGAVIYIGRKLLGFIGVPRSIKFIGRSRLQLR